MFFRPKFEGPTYALAEEVAKRLSPGLRETVSSFVGTEYGAVVAILQLLNADDRMELRVFNLVDVRITKKFAFIEPNELFFMVAESIPVDVDET